VSKLADHANAALAAEDEEREEKRKLKRDHNGILRKQGLLYEFDCPECDANNPWDDGFAEGGEVRCHYCGQELRAILVTEKKAKFRLI
jgi:transcription elongation factor Elf1